MGEAGASGLLARATRALGRGVGEAGSAPGTSRGCMGLYVPMRHVSVIYGQKFPD